MDFDIKNIYIYIYIIKKKITQKHDIVSHLCAKIQLSFIPRDKILYFLTGARSNVLSALCQKEACMVEWCAN